jgi:hypothetical protein
MFLAHHASIPIPNLRIWQANAVNQGPSRRFSFGKALGEDTREIIARLGSNVF